MKNLLHKSATSAHYNKEAQCYDVFNEESSKLINATIENILRKNKVKSVLDLACGTGSQVFWLTKRNFNVVGVDINQKMLKIAKNKATNVKVDVKFIKGDMRTTKAGLFDAVITMFNAIGHLTKKDFAKTIKNAGCNLSPNGLYVFDIFNLNYLIKDNNITKLTIDWQKKQGDIVTREIQYSTIDQDGVLASYDTYFEQKNTNKPKISYASQTLQTYSSEQLKKILEENGFKIIKKSCVDGTRFSDTKSERLLVVAKKL